MAKNWVVHLEFYPRSLTDCESGAYVPYDTPQGEYLAAGRLGEALKARGEVVMLLVRITTLSAAFRAQNRAKLRFEDIRS